MFGFSLGRAANRLAVAYTHVLLKFSKAQVGEGLRVSGRLPRISSRGGLSIGNDVHLRGAIDPVRLKTVRRGKIVLGDNAFLNTGVRIYAEDLVEIGPDARIGDECVLCDTPFHAVHEDRPSGPRPIRIGRNVWLARGVIVLPGVSIGDHSVVAAGGVVFEDIPARQLWRGNPAAFVRDVRASDTFVRE
jgi:acetyltransferase-like isoleucine patch superfamily enzyme